MTVGLSINMLGPTIDMMWVGKLGATSVAAVGVAGIALQLIMSLMVGLSAGVKAVVARRVGASDIPGANHAAQQSYVISAFLAGAVILSGIFLPRPLLTLMGVEAEVITQGVGYLRIVLVGLVFMSFGIMSGSIMQSSGDSMTPMKIAIVTRLFHIALSPFLIFGWWIFPRLEVNGAALTNTISAALGVTVGLWLLFSGRSRLQPTLRRFRLDRSVVWRMVKIGIPASVTQMQWSFTELFVMMFVSPFGTVAVAAHSINQRLLLILIMPGVALGQAAGVLVGQNLGANQPARAARTGWLAAGIMEIFSVVSSVALLIWAEPVLRLFSSDPELIKLGSDFLRIAAAGYFLIGLTVVLQQAIAGAGDTTVLMVFGLAMVWGIQIPLAYFLSQVPEFGIYGVRWALVAGGLIGGIAYPWYFRAGRWKRKTV